LEGVPSIPVSTFSLKHTFESAQPLTFYADYNEMSNTIVYPHNSTIINMMHSGETDKGNLHVMSSNSALASEDVKKRFRLDDDMQKIYKKISTDSNMKKAIESYKGMRLTVNDPWETTMVFILSQFNNVKRIRLITKNIIKKFGIDITDSRGVAVAKAFPQSGDLLKATVKDFTDCGAGFRDKYIKEAAEYCAHNMDLHKLPSNNYVKLKERLMEIKGVGEKVADCIALMGYGNLEAFPIDVHVKRSMEKLYFKGKKKKMKEIMDFAEEEWGNYRGYAQQYLFHTARTSGK